ncbi:MAG TPA: hypothetical protein DDZ80_21455 [Cyanobacteria bacterium UBA8803]|nr:hypothetical protein [Cyanobacteria bacterium UBA8803]
MPFYSPGLGQGIVIGYWLFVVGCLLLVVCYWLFVFYVFSINNEPQTTNNQQLTTNNQQLTTN